MNGHLTYLIMKIWLSDWPPVGHKYQFKDKKFSLGPGFEPASPVLGAGALPTEPPRRFIYFGILFIYFFVLFLLWS